MMALRFERRPVEAVEPGLRAQMYALIRAQFEGSDPEVFGADLTEKQQVLLLWTPDGALAGFSTLRSWAEELPEGPVSVLFSGDTVVSTAAWGSPALATAWLEAAMELRSAVSAGPVYWMLISSGFRTYRFLPTFFREFWPRYDQPTPPEVAALMDRLARRRYGALVQDGVVRLPQPSWVRPEVAGLTAERLRNPHVAWFHARNPGHAQGDELVCLARVDPDNFTPAALRVLRSLSGAR